MLGAVFTVTVVTAELEVQPATATSTLQLFAVLTVILCVVAPFDQVLPVAELEVKVTEPPVQKVVAPLALIVGTAGAPGSFIVVDTVLDTQPSLKLKLQVPADKLVIVNGKVVAVDPAAVPLQVSVPVAVPVI